MSNLHKKVRKYGGFVMGPTIGTYQKKVAKNVHEKAVPGNPGFSNTVRSTATTPLGGSGG